MTVQLTLPYPPSANRLWVRAKKGMRMSDRYRVWINEAIWTIKAQRPGKIDGPYKLSIHAQRPDKRARDIDNLIKPISDALECAGVVRNDSDCEMVTARWVTTGGAGVVVFVDRAATEISVSDHPLAVIDAGADEAVHTRGPDAVQTRSERREG